MRVLRYLVAGSLAALGLAVAGVLPAMAAQPDPDATLRVTKPVQIVTQTKETPIAGGGTSYYCAVGTFIPFDDLAGWRPVSAGLVIDNRPSTLTIGRPPYADGAEINGLIFAPTGGAHHVQYGGFSYAQGGTANVFTNCANVVARSDPRYADTATVTYEHTPACARAITKLLAARTAVARASTRVRNATGAARTAAVVALQKAKARLTTATKAYRTHCR